MYTSACVDRIEAQTPDSLSSVLSCILPIGWVLQMPPKKKYKPEKPKDAPAVVELVTARMRVDARMRADQAGRSVIEMDPNSNGVCQAAYKKYYPAEKEAYQKELMDTARAVVAIRSRAKYLPPPEVCAVIASFIGTDKSGDVLRTLADTEQNWVEWDEKSGIPLPPGTPGDTRSFTTLNGLLHSRADKPSWTRIGVEKWHRRGVLHRDNDLPAAIIRYTSRDGDVTKEWWINGVLSRLGGLPAVVSAYFCEWWEDGRRHRTGGLPALEKIGQTSATHQHLEYWEFGKQHRLGGEPAVVRGNRTEYWEYGLLHRDGDLPAVVTTRGRRMWYKRGVIERGNDLPAIIDSDGSCVWFLDGKIHRDGDRPAVVQKDGTMIWYAHGRIHRPAVCGPAVVMRTGRIEFRDRGLLHRLHAPALITAHGTLAYYREGVLHRDADEGPAVIKQSGAATWYVDGVVVQHCGEPWRFKPSNRKRVVELKKRAPRDLWVSGFRVPYPTVLPSLDDLTYSSDDDDDIHTFYFDSDGEDDESTNMQSQEEKSRSHYWP